MIVVSKRRNYILEKTEDNCETLQMEAKEYYREMYKRYRWVARFSYRVYTEIISRKTAKHFGLKFKAERINQTPTTRKIIPVGVIVCAILMIFCFAKPQVSASAVAKCKNAADNPVYHGNAQTAGGQQDNIVTKRPTR